MGWLKFRLGNGIEGFVDGDNPSAPPQVTIANPGGTTFQIVTQDSISISIGTVLYFQNGLPGVAKGLLLVLTNTPNFIKVIKTSIGLVPIP